MFVNSNIYVNNFELTNQLTLFSDDCTVYMMIYDETNTRRNSIPYIEWNNNWQIN